MEEKTSQTKQAADVDKTQRLFLFVLPAVASFIGMAAAFVYRTNMIAAIAGAVIFFGLYTAIYGKLLSSFGIWEGWKARLSGLFFVIFGSLIFWLLIISST